MSTWAKMVEPEEEDQTQENDDSLPPPAEGEEMTPQEQLAAWIKANGGGAAAGAKTGEEEAQEPMTARDIAEAVSTPETAPEEQPSVPATNKENALSLRDQLQKFLGKQTGGIDSMQQLADLYKGQMAKENNRPNNTGINALADYYWGTNFSKAFAPPMKGSEQTEAQMKAQDAVNKERQPVTSDLINEYKSDNNAVSKEQANYYRGLSAENKQATQKDHFLDKQEENMAKDMNPMSSAYGSGSNNLGARLARARSVTALIKQHPNYDLDPREQKDMALSLASLISNQNRVPYELVQSLVPKTFGGDTAKFMEYFKNNPQSTDSQEFVKRMMQTVQKEQATTTDQIRAIQKQRATGYHQLATNRPNSHKTIFDAGNNYLDMPNLDTTTGGTPPAAPIPIKNPKTGEKAWKMPDGSIKPRDK